LRRLFRRGLVEHQEVFGFIRRMNRRDTQFRRAILIATAATAVAIVLASTDLRDWLRVTGSRLKNVDLFGAASVSSRPLSDEEWTARRELKVRKADEALRSFLSNSPADVRALFEATGMAPPEAILRWGRGDQVFMFSAQVFEKDDQGRSYRLKPNTRSVWLRELVRKGGPHGLLLIPDRPEVRALVPKAGGIVVEDSVQNTNSWGLRGPEPNLNARVRVMVLGDSFMQGMFIGDDVTPPVQLENDLAKEWGCSVSVLNTGVVGYSPEQYYYTFQEYLERFQPHLLIISVCHNDFGDDGDVLMGKGNLYDEAAYWINRIIQECRGKNLNYLIVPVPHRENVNLTRSNGHYPGKLMDFVSLSPKMCLLLTDEFIDEELRLRHDKEAHRRRPQGYELYNTAIGDGHFSAVGSKLWAERVGTRLALMFDPAHLPRQFYRTKLAPSSP